MTPHRTRRLRAARAPLLLRSASAGNEYEPCPARPAHRRTSTRRAEAIATSSGQNDAGLFELNFRDERYLPFEYLGAVSRWRIELPPENNYFDLDTLSDVVLHLNYTAREGGEVLRDAAARGRPGPAPRRRAAVLRRSPRLPRRLAGCPRTRPVGGCPRSPSGANGGCGWASLGRCSRSSPADESDTVDRVLLYSRRRTPCRAPPPRPVLVGRGRLRPRSAIRVFTSRCLARILLRHGGPAREPARSAARRRAASFGLDFPAQAGEICNAFLVAHYNAAEWPRCDPRPAPCPADVARTGDQTVRVPSPNGHTSATPAGSSSWRPHPPPRPHRSGESVPGWSASTLKQLCATIATSSERDAMPGQTNRTREPGGTPPPNPHKPRRRAPATGWGRRCRAAADSPGPQRIREALTRPRPADCRRSPCPKAAARSAASARSSHGQPVTGTAHLTVPVATSPGRGGFGPSLRLGYDSGSRQRPVRSGLERCRCRRSPARPTRACPGTGRPDESTCSSCPVPRTWSRSCDERDGSWEQTADAPDRRRPALPACSATGRGSRACSPASSAGRDHRSGETHWRTDHHRQRHHPLRRDADAAASPTRPTPPASSAG